MSQAPLLLRRLVAVHESLQGAGIDHAVGGALALAVHATPRFTSDLDLNITADPQRPELLLESLPPGPLIHDQAAAEIRTHSQVRLDWPDPDTPLDLFLPAHPVYHHLVVERAAPYDFFGTTIKVLQATDLMVFKALCNRTKDWADIESLVEHGAGDVAEAVDWVARIMGSDSPQAKRLSAFELNPGER